MDLSPESLEERLAAWMDQAGVRAEWLRFDAPVHSVADAAAQAQAAVADIVKSVVLLSNDGLPHVAVVKGEDRVSLPRAREAGAGAALRIASPEEVLRATGYPAGGVPPFGFPASILVDPRVMERAWVYAGGGSPRALLRVAPSELLRACGGRVVHVRQ